MSSNDTHALDEAKAEVDQAEMLTGGSSAVVATTGPIRSPLVTLAWITPGTIWLLLFLIAPLIMIVLVSLWERSLVGFSAFSFTLDSYGRMFETSVYLDTMRSTILRSLIVTALCVLIGYPIAYYLARCVKTLKYPSPPSPQHAHRQSTPRQTESAGSAKAAPTRPYNPAPQQQLPKPRAQPHSSPPTG